MKKIEKLIDKAKGNKIALVIPEKLVDDVTNYFGNTGLTKFSKDTTAFGGFSIDFDSAEKILSWGRTQWYIDLDYELIILNKEDFEDITEYSNTTDTYVDNRTFIVMLNNRPVINSQSNTIYFSEEEYNQYLDTLDNLRDIVIIPAYGKQFERTAHISIY